jgi:glucokinase
MGQEVLAGDVGGTNARLAIVEVDGATGRIVHDARFASQDYPGLAPIVREFCAAAGRPPRAAFGIACPVVADDCRATNLPWTVNRKALAEAIGIPRTAILNDFSAIGRGLAMLGADDFVVLQPGEAVARAPVALIGAGTGLGEGYLLWNGSRYEVYPSEGGHADLAAHDAIDFGLVQALQREYGHASVERLLSGPGIESAYRYLASAGVAPEQAAVHAELQHGDAAAVITGHALAGTDPLCVRTLELFVTHLGAVAGNLALTILATGGVYVGGGIAPRIVDWLRGDRFLDAFRGKGRLGAVLRRIPVRVIMNSNVGLLGAAAVAAALPE